MQASKKILIAPDKFKGTLSARQAGDAMREGAADALESLGIEAKFTIKPMADGGEGSHESLGALGKDFQERFLELPSSTGTSVSVPYWISPSEAFLESAKVVGLELPGARNLPVIERSTYGIGQWARSMLLENDFSSISLFLGGSATCDGGFGIARALGFHFQNSKGQSVEYFKDIEEGMTVSKEVLPFHAEVHIFSDVISPLLGEKGAARLFSPQKGASGVEVELLEKKMRVYAEALLKLPHNPETTIETLGAAGGMSLPFFFCPELKASLRPGIDFFLELSGIVTLLKNDKPDLILSGEGCTDKGTLQGKVVMGVYGLSKKQDVPFAVVSGRVKDRDLLAGRGLTRLYDTCDVCGEAARLSPSEAMDRLKKTTNTAVLEIFAGEKR